MASNALGSDKKSSSDDVCFPGECKMCKICLQAGAVYTCPRCNLPYCSLACYKSEKHTDCSEPFYKDNFIQALKDTKGRPEDKQKILEMLAKLERGEEPGPDSDDEPEDDETQSLQARLAGLDLDQDPDAVWERLTPQERRDFDAMLEAGAVSSLLEEWAPWWIRKDKELIRELEDTASSMQKTGSCDPPMVLDSIPRLSELLKTPPSPLLIFNLLNILYCYAFTTRLYNGAHAEIPLYAVQTFQEICSVISANVCFSSTEDAIQSAIQTVTKLKSVPGERQHLISIIQDVIHIIHRRSSSSSSCCYVQAALSDLHQLLKQAKLIYKKATSLAESSQKGALASKTSIFQAKKKVIFYLSWARENGSVLSARADELRILHASMQAELQRHDNLKAGVQKNLKELRPKQNKLIEEIS